MSETEPAARRTIDTSVAHSARVHDYWLGGLELAEPGVVAVQQWRPGSDLEARARSAMWGGVARKL